MRNGHITDQMITTYQHPRIMLRIGNYTIFEDELGANSFIYRGGCGGGFAPGGCETASCSFTIANFDGINDGLPLNEGAEVLVYVGYGETPETSIYDKFATIYITDVKELKNVFNAVGYDKLHEADKVNITFTAGTSTTVNGIITAAAQAAGITVAQLPTSGGSIPVTIDADTSMTCRQAIAKALEISGNVGFCNANGELVCKWFDTTPAKTYDDYANAEYLQTSGYTGVSVGSTSQGSAPNVYAVTGNPFVSTNNEADICTRLYGILIGTGVSFGGVGVLADPRLEPADVISVPFFRSDGTTDTRIVPIAGLTFKNSLIEDITCDIQTSDDATDLRQTVEEAISSGSGGGSGQYIEKINGTGRGTTLTTPTVSNMTSNGAATFNGAENESNIIPAASMNRNVALFDEAEIVRRFGSKGYGAYAATMTPIYQLQAGDEHDHFRQPLCAIPFSYMIPDQTGAWTQDGNNRRYTIDGPDFPIGCAPTYCSGTFFVEASDPASTPSDARLAPLTYNFSVRVSTGQIPKYKTKIHIYVRPSDAVNDSIYLGSQPSSSVIAVYFTGIFYGEYSYPSQT